MYHPPGEGLTEFIELLNISTSAPVSLRGLEFTTGIEFNFTNSSITTLAPGGRLLVLRDLAAFTAVYGTNLPIAGVFTNGSALSNGGELLTLVDGDREEVQAFNFRDSAPWPIEADGGGRSLVLIAPETSPDHSLGTNWKASSIFGGTPGKAEDDGLPFDPLGDANGNGEPDLIDYALGNDLGLPQIQPNMYWEPGASGNPAALKLSYPVSTNATRATITVHFSTDLATWQDGAANLEGLSTEDLGSGRVLRIWSVKAPLRDEPRLFMRLQVTAQ